MFLWLKSVGSLLKIHTLLQSSSWDFLIILTVFSVIQKTFSNKRCWHEMLFLVRFTKAAFRDQTQLLFWLTNFRQRIERRRICLSVFSHEASISLLGLNTLNAVLRILEFERMSFRSQETDFTKKTGTLNAAENLLASRIERTCAKEAAMSVVPTLVELWVLTPCQASLVVVLVDPVIWVNNRGYCFLM